MNGGMRVRLGRAGPALRRLLRPGRARTARTDLETWTSQDWQPSRTPSSWRTGWPAPASWWTSTSRSSFWFDWWIEQAVFEPYLQRFAAYYYNRGLEWGKGVAINYKYEAFPEGAAVLDIERGQLKDIRPMFWQNDTSVSKNSWGYVEDQDYKTPDVASSTTWSTS